MITSLKKQVVKSDCRSLLQRPMEKSCCIFIKEPGWCKIPGWPKKKKNFITVVLYCSPVHHAVLHTPVHNVDWSISIKTPEEEEESATYWNGVWRRAVAATMILKELCLFWLNYFNWGISNHNLQYLSNCMALLSSP